MSELLCPNFRQIKTFLGALAPLVSTLLLETNTRSFSGTCRSIKPASSGNDTPSASAVTKADAACTSLHLTIYTPHSAAAYTSALTSSTLCIICTHNDWCFRRAAEVVVSSSYFWLRQHFGKFV